MGKAESLEMFLSPGRASPTKGASGQVAARRFCLVPRDCGRASDPRPEVLKPAEGQQGCASVVPWHQARGASRAAEGQEEELPTCRRSQGVRAASRTRGCQRVRGEGTTARQQMVQKWPRGWDTCYDITHRAALSGGG